MKIVFLDVASMGKDLDYSRFYDLGEVTMYDYTKEDEIAGRVADADVVVTNKMMINEKTVGDATNLKLVCVTATGTNNLDKEFLYRRGIEWRNVAGYSTETVAQHTFALLFWLIEKLPYYDEYVKSEKYVNDMQFTHFTNVFHEISGKTWGIIGLGEIGRRVAGLAKAFGCNVIYYSTSVDFDTLLRESDIISVHAPLNSDTEGLMDAEAFDRMKNTALFINVGRGPIVDEAALADAIEAGKIAGAGLDVLTKEPMAEDNPLRRIKDSVRLIITPHIAWAGVEARTRLMSIVADQIEEFSRQQ